MLSLEMERQKVSAGSSDVGPAFDPGEQSFDAGTVTLDAILNPVLPSGAAGSRAPTCHLCSNQERNEIFCARQNEDVRLFGVLVSW